MYSQKIHCTDDLVCVCVPIHVHFLCLCFLCVTLTFYDVSQALCEQQVFEASHLLFQLTHQAVVGVLVDHSVTADLFGTISIPGGIEVNKVMRMIPPALHTELQ